MGLLPGRKTILWFLAGRDGMTIFAAADPQKRRKSRTAFTNHQIYELRSAFSTRSTCPPSIATKLRSSWAFTNAQVITWFQNRRAV